jgi:anthranilate 1,2-dioxygenase large subunit
MAANTGFCGCAVPVLQDRNGLSLSENDAMEQGRNAPLVEWPREDYSRVPFRLYHDPEIYRQEQEKIFRGQCWAFVGLEAELPNPGDFRTSFIGDTPILVTRGMDGALNTMVNRCAHRGALVRREAWGNAPEHICIYHRWCYAPDGTLMGLPFRRGLKGKGGMSPDFKTEEHGMRKLRTESYAGVIFASFSDAVEPLHDFLGPVFRGHFDRLFGRPIRILGYQRQRIYANWKFYLENTRDTYHGSLLHEFQSTFGLSRVTQKGGVTMDARHRHNLTWSKVGTDDEAEFSSLYKDNKVHDSSLSLRDPDIVKYHREFADGISLAICSLFPNATVHQIGNSLATRQLRTFGPDEFELHWTLFGYQDDSEEMIQHRLLQANNVGPAGLVSMEDGEAIEIAHRGTASDPGACTVIEMGGRGAITDLDHRVNDVPCRGFWSYYSELMGIEPQGAVR